MVKIRNINKDEFLEVLNGAINKKQGIICFVKIPGNKELEEIKNKPVDVQNKKEYYDKSYDEDMNHKFAPGVSIVKVDVFQENFLNQ